MKLPSFLIAFLLCAQLCIAQAVKNSLSEEHLKGKVKRIESSLFRSDPANGKIDTLAPHDRFIDLYDENGNETEDSYFGKDGLLISKWIKQYNGKNEETEEDYYSKNVLESTRVFKYDEKGNLVESDSKYISDNTSDKVLYRYDDKDNMVEDDILNKGDSLRYKDIYKYDTKGNKIEMDYFHLKEDTMRVRWTFNYNDVGLRVQEGRHTRAGELQIENTITYDNPDKMGNWQLETRRSNGISKEFAKRSSFSVTIRKIYYY